MSNDIHASNQSADSTDFANQLDHNLYLSMLPGITAVANRRFASLPAGERAERVAEAIAGGFVMYLSLVRRGRADQVQTAGFVVNAVRAAAQGRQVGSSQAGTDVLSRVGRRKHGRQVLSFDADSDTSEDSTHWLHEAIADHRTSVPEQVAIRLDGGRWFDALTGREQQMVRLFASGERAITVARRFQLSPARVSQLRRQWLEQWKGQVEAAA